MRRKILSSLLLVVLVATGAWAQQQQQRFTQQLPLAPAVNAPYFFQPSYIKQAFYRPVKFQLASPGSLRDQVQDGKLTLSLADVVRLVVARNTDVWIARMPLQSADNSVVSSYSRFDPRFTSSFSYSQSASQVTNTASDASKTMGQGVNTGYNQTYKTGATLQVGFNNTRSSTNNSFQVMNPTLSSSLQINMSQPLLQNRGIFQNTATIIVAKIRQQTARRTFEQSLTGTLVSAMNQYWSVVQARESLKIAQRAFGVAEKTYDRDKRKLELGALPALDIFQSQASFERSKVSVVNAQFSLQKAEDQLRKMIAADLDPETRNLPLNLTDDPFPARLIEVDVQDQITKAFAYRPDVDITKRNQAIDDINVRTAMNGLKPTMNLTAGYSLRGAGGNTYSHGSLISSGGLIDAWNILWSRNNPTYTVGLSLNFPIRDRAASASFAGALISQRTGLLNERNQVQQITLDVKNAVSNLEQQKAAMQVSKVALDASTKNAEAAQRKWELGATTVFELLAAQQQLASDELSYMQTAIAYRNAVVSLQQVTGLLIQENNVVLDDAMRLTQTPTVKQVVDQPPAATPPPAAKKD